ncbi:zinc finger and SCAN domain-containing protein 2-like isoform X1 [Neodiprion virginianus]|uniref:zinc finger and SCAN domain-containing protein 2-like isoform X1 n=1 Tax=Neodiprion virginianus TaxID=2961670 RepID=UPI001EE6C8A3|nr:zinc finger and SCAN domain-containing protein 2-like isoform X1 [Neodiprion virginianus]XP_046623865.1 zinc finger and SCAN domain-containing protein 2-like isoform X1 [Neodiprion virginianus]XP_046623866.1 zinc finger and SCAN domain-containing protein 2-like isoform X1 [Neodiprion virginianus]
MEVATDEEAQAVLLEEMEGAQYITIQPADAESLSKGVPLITLNGELIPERMVVEMMNVGVGSEYSTATQYYETEDDLLSHELTEEDRRLAAALVAVQLQQQQKQQQLHNQQHEDPTLPDVGHLDSLSPVNAYMQTIPDPDPPPVYPTMHSMKRISQSQNVKQEFINIKSEYEIDVSAESSEDAAPTSGPKRSLPHKKRIPKKLKQQSKRTSVRRDNAKLNQDIVSQQPANEPLMHAFRCELCGCSIGGQLKFFEHLKAHYEPVKVESRIAQTTNTSITISVSDSVQGIDTTVIEEFSEPEDLMEGIRGVVEETGAHIDEEADGSLNDVNGGPTLWAISDVPDHGAQEQVETTTINENDLLDREEIEVPQTKKKKSQKHRRSSTVDELACPQCGRSFNHKNSLVYHMRSHSGERPHQCDVCGKSFFAASALKVHKRLHSGDKPYKCDDCGRHFRQWGDLKYHSTSIHSEQKQFQCEYCGKDFARKYSLIVHRRIHTGEKNYRCEYCNKTFRASSYLQNHRRIHTGEKPHPCTVCGKPFRVRSDMKRHLNTHSRGRFDRPVNRTTMTKNLTDDENKASQVRTIQNSLVEDLKLEVEGNGVELVSPEDNPESILPHEGGHNMDYSAARTADGGTDRDPLEADVRSTDTLYTWPCYHL